MEGRVVLHSCPSAWLWVSGARCRRGSRQWSPTASALSGFPSLLLPGPIGTRSGSEDATAAGPRVVRHSSFVTPPTSP